MEIITNIEDVGLSEVEKFVLDHPYGNFFQSTNAYRFYDNVENNQPVLIVAKSGKTIVGTLMGVILKEGKGLKGFFSRRCIVSGGPLVKDNKLEVCEILLSKLNDIVKHKAIYTQFRNFFDLPDTRTNFHKLGWQFEEHLNIMIDLSKTEEVLWKEVYSKRRNEIRRAEKEGTSFRVLEGKDEFDTTYDILKEVYDRAKLPLPGIQFFRTAYDILGPDHFKIFLAVNDEKIIGTMYVLCFRDIMYDWYAGSYQAYYKKYPNDLIPWKAFLWGKENGFMKFDFGGAGKPGVPYGVRDYKKKFGGEFVNYGRFEKIHAPIKMKIAKVGFKIWQQLKSGRASS